MLIKSTGIALFLVLLPMAFAADREDLYTQVGTDPSPAQLISDGKIVLGHNFTNNPIPGSEINVNHALLAQQTGVLGPFSAINRVHSPDSGSRTNYDNFPRWYQQDGISFGRRDDNPGLPKGQQ